MTSMDLPKQHRKREADFGVAFRAWWKLHPFSGEIELKDTRGKDSLPFSALDPQQELVACADTILIRRTMGTVGAADYTGLVRSQYWIAIKYPKAFYVIGMKEFLRERDRSSRKSLTSARAAEIATYSSQ